MHPLPFVTKEQIEEIVKTCPTPFHIYDEKGIRRNAENVKKAFSWNPGFIEYFAVKATPNPRILSILNEYGFGADCASFNELVLAKAAGIPGDHVMFSSNDTPFEEYTYAAHTGSIINLDDITHIDFCEKACGGRLPETMSIRFNPGGIFRMSNGIMDNPGDSKYGMTEPQVFEAVRVMMKKGVKHFGIHAFLASNTLTNDYYPVLSRILFELAVKVREDTGADVSFVNLSGGVGVAYKPEQRGNDILEIGDRVRQVYEDVLIPAGMGNLRVCTEMGRFMTGPYGGLVTKAIHEKHTYKEYIGVDACAVDLIRPAMYGAYHHITVLGKENETSDHTYDITGSLCENNDKFAVDRAMPRIDMGDYLFIHDSGAHGYSMGYNYNGKMRSAELLLRENGSTELIRRAETSRDYFATFDCTKAYADIDETLKEQDA